MKTLAVALFGIHVLCSTGIDGTIHPIRSISEMQAHLDSLTPDGIAVFDVDQTLIAPKDKILRPCGRQYLYHLIKKHRLTPHQLDRLTSKALLQFAQEVLEPASVEMIREVQSRGVPAIALTAMRTGRWGDVHSMEQWRYDQLKSFDFDFSGAFAGNPLGALIEDEAGKTLVSFSNGIIASDETPKGEALAALFKFMGWYPSQVVFVDDRLDYIISVEQSMEELNIPSTSYYYMPQLDEQVDEAIASYQVESYIRNETWLSDEHVASYLEAERSRR